MTTFSWPTDSGEVTTLLKQAVSISSVYNFHCLFSFIFKGNNQLSRLVNSQFISFTEFVYSIEEETFGKFESMCLNFFLIFWDKGKIEMFSTWNTELSN